MQVAADCKCVVSQYIAWQTAEVALNRTDRELEPCNLLVKKDYECLIKVISNAVEDCKASQCFQPCYEEVLNRRVTGAVWPRADYLELMGPSWESRNKNAKFKGVGEARDAVAKLEVFFEELNYESVTESEAMDAWSFLSNLGGTLGLYGG